MSSKYELVILGSGGVGKSAITIQFIQGNFVEKYDPTIEDSYRKDIVVDGESCMLDILDTAGQEEYEGMRDEYMRSGKGFILVYSITDKSSCHDLEDIHEKLLKAKDLTGDEVPIILVGNKCDLTEERQVSETEGREMAKRFGKYVKFMEASAKSRINIEEIFTEMIRYINRMDKGEAPEPQAAAPAPAPAAAPAATAATPAAQPQDRPAAPAATPASPAHAESPTPSQRKAKKPRKTKTVVLDASEYSAMLSSLPSLAAHTPAQDPRRPAILAYDFSEEKSESMSVGAVEEVGDLGEWVGVRWVSIEGEVSREVAAAVADKFQIHPVAVADLSSPGDIRPKLDVYPPATLHIKADLISRAGPEAPLQVSVVNLFLSERTVVSQVGGPAEVLVQVKSQVAEAASPLRKHGPSFLLYEILNALAVSCGPVADSYRKQLETIEQHALAMPSPDLLKQVYVLKREVTLFRKYVEPMIEVLAALEKEALAGTSHISPADRPYFTAVKNNYARVCDVLDTYNSMCDSLLSIKAEPSGKNCLLM